MLRLSIVLSILLAAPAVAGAVEENADGRLSRLWSDLSASENFHYLDNATSALFYDFTDNEQHAGVASTFYEYRQFACDLGVIRSIESDASGYPLLGVNIKVGRWLAQYEWAARLTKPIKKYAPLLRGTTIGTWGGRDFSAGKFRGGVYGGLEKKFGNDGK